MILKIIGGIVFLAPLVVLIYMYYKRKPVPDKLLECDHQWEDLPKSFLQQDIRFCRKCDELQDRIVLKGGSILRDWTTISEPKSDG